MKDSPIKESIEDLCHPGNLKEILWKEVQLTVYLSAPKGIFSITSFGVGDYAPVLGSLLLLVALIYAMVVTYKVHCLSKSEQGEPS